MPDFTSRGGLILPGRGEGGARPRVNVNFQTIVDQESVGGFMIWPAMRTPTGLPSGRQFYVAGGIARPLKGPAMAVANFPAQAAAAGATTYVWLKRDLTLGTGTAGFPAAADVTSTLDPNGSIGRIGRVVCDADNITAIFDHRREFELADRGRPFSQLACEPTLVNSTQHGPTYNASHDDHFIIASTSGADLEIALPDPLGRNHLVIVHASVGGEERVSIREGPVLNKWRPSCILIGRGEESYDTIAAGGFDVRHVNAITYTAAPSILPYTTRDLYRLDASGGPFTVPLPFASQARDVLLRFRKIDGSVNVASVQAKVIVPGVNEETFDDGNNVKQLTARGQTLTVVSDGTQWEIH